MGGIVFSSQVLEIRSKASSSQEMWLLSCLQEFGLPGSSHPSIVSYPRTVYEIQKKLIASLTLSGRFFWIGALTLSQY